MGRFFIPTTPNGPSFASSFPPILHRQDTANPRRFCAMNSKPAQLSPSLPLRRVKAIVGVLLKTPVQDVNNSSAFGHDARKGCALWRKANSEAVVTGLPPDALCPNSSAKK